MPSNHKLPSRHNQVELKWLERFAKLLDSQFRIPGTNISFGLDPLIGFIPVLGDIITYVMSALLIYYAAKYGASGRVVAKMFLNIIVDFLIAKIPALGYVFDFVFKANERNLILLKEHYYEQKHQGTVWPFVIGAFVVLLLIGFLSVWLFVVLFEKLALWLEG